MAPCSPPRVKRRDAVRQGSGQAKRAAKTPPAPGPAKRREEVAGQRISIAEAARKYGVPYSTLWRLVTGGFRREPRLPKDLDRRLQEALKELGFETSEGR
jgi:hypothetical protein